MKKIILKIYCIWMTTNNRQEYRMGTCEKKRERILMMLKQYHRLSVSDVVNALNASEATVRRYFKDMEKSGQLIRVCGGARLPTSSVEIEYHFSRKSATHMAEKQLIGRAAAQLVESHDRLFFDSGTTVRECGNALVERCAAETLEDIGIITNSLVYNDELPQFCNMGLVGGNIRPLRMDLSGMLALNNIRRYNFSKAFLGVDGIASDGTLSTTDEDTSLLAEAALEQSKNVVILADSSKLGVVSFVPYGTMKGKKFTLVTDSNADPEIIHFLQKQGIQVIVISQNKKEDL